MNILDAIILGVVEGITEFLPVSSTGHLILTSHLLDIAGDPFITSFEIIIQLGAILAVVVLYSKLLFNNKQLLAKVVTAFIPTAILGLAFYPFAKKYLLGNELVVVIALALGGVALIVFEKLKKNRELESEAEKGTENGSENSLENMQENMPEKNIDVSSITYKQALVIGLFQSIAIIPGVSRSAATIVGGEVIGLSRKAIVEFSFLLAIPTMIAATGLDVIKEQATFSNNELLLLAVGFIVSFVVALVAIKTFLNYIQKHSFTVFGVYRIVLAGAYALLFL